MPILLSNITTGAGDAALTPDERNWIREVLGVSRKTSDKKYVESETSFEAFLPFDNKSARYWMNLYESYGESLIEIDAEGATISKKANRRRVAQALFNLVFAKDNITPLEDLDLSEYRESSSKVSMVSVQFIDDEALTSEY